nr:hypothetical protein CFP56_76467 [Quercus suber]
MSSAGEAGNTTVRMKQGRSRIPRHTDIIRSYCPEEVTILRAAKENTVLEKPSSCCKFATAAYIYKQLEDQADRTKAASWLSIDWNDLYTERCRSIYAPVYLYHFEACSVHKDQRQLVAGAMYTRLFVTSEHIVLAPQSPPLHSIPISAKADCVSPADLKASRVVCELLNHALMPWLSATARSVTTDAVHPPSSSRTNYLVLRRLPIHWLCLSIPMPGDGNMGQVLTNASTYAQSLWSVYGCENETRTSSSLIGFNFLLGLSVAWCPLPPRCKRLRLSTIGVSGLNAQHNLRLVQLFNFSLHDGGLMHGA